MILIETTRLDGGLHWKVQKFFFSWETFNKQDVKDSWSFFLGIWLKQLFGGRISSKRRIFLCGKAYTLTQLNLLDLLLTHIKWFSCLDPFWDKVWGVLSLWNLFPKKFLVSVPLKGLGMLKWPRKIPFSNPKKITRKTCHRNCRPKKSPFPKKQLYTAHILKQ